VHILYWYLVEDVEPDELFRVCNYSTLVSGLGVLLPNGLFPCRSRGWLGMGSLKSMGSAKGLTLSDSVRRLGGCGCSGLCEK
jgi:hypothetical protein